MEYDIPKDTLNMIVDLLCNNDKEGAILVYYRASNKPLEQSWETIQRILMDMGEDDNSLPKQVDKDFSYSTVQYYLQSVAERWRDNLLVIIIFVVCLTLAALRIVPSGVKVVTEIRSWSWPSTEATVIAVKENGRYRSTRPPYVYGSYLDFTFQYTVEGQMYTDRRKREIYSDKFSQPGRTLLIAYNPNNPTQTVYDGEIGIGGLLTHLLAIAIGFIPFVVGASCGFILVSSEWSCIQLKRLDQKILAEQ